MSRLEVQDVAEEFIAERSFESLVVELSTQFISLPPDRIDAAIEDAQRKLCQSFRLDRSTLWQRSATSDTLLLTHVFQPDSCPQLTESPDGQLLTSSDWVLNATKAPPVYRQMQAQAFFPWVLREVHDGRTVAISSLDDLPPQADRDRDILRQFGTRSCVVVPLAIGTDWLGCLSFSSMQAEIDWSDPIVKRIELVGHLFANALARKCSDQTHRENEARLRAILDTAVEGIITIDIRGMIESANLGVTRLFGFQAGELIGQNIRILLPLSDREFHDECLTAYQRTANPRIIGVGRELIGQRKDGSFFHMELDVRESIVGQRHFFTGFVRDITERLDAEQAARDFSGRLINAQEEERARVARELHDDVSQRLARLAIDVGRLQRPARNIDVEGVITSVREEIARLSTDVHAISYELHPSALVDLGLDDALKAECARFSERSAVPIEVKLRDLPLSVPRDMALGLFRIAQEALRNAVRHGHAAKIELTLWGVDKGLQLAVRDDGVGFDPARNRHRPSLGLASMSERARLLGGELDVESEPGHGTTVVAWVPLSETIP